MGQLMGAFDDREMLEAAKEEVGKLEREVALLRAERDAALELVDALRAEKDSPHADAKYWLEWQKARAEIRRLGRLVNMSTIEIHSLHAERDAALAVIEQVLNLVGDIGPEARRILAQSPADALAEHDRAVKAEALEEAAQMRRGADALGVESVPADWLLERAAEYRKAGK